ncbi:hypothetical protein NNW99_36155 [Streptomyces sp. CRCS-T-1]|nr:MULTISPECIES: hypothetical protein [Streptomyces]UUA10683.1 hypothetical protein NNW98_36270 [Streptomyces koelreuteriae]UUA18290.1 hypothetical protein NNW99_36155 [Streptomyces sp. CRCS-T-1]
MVEDQRRRQVQPGQPAEPVHQLHGADGRHAEFGEGDGRVGQFAGRVTADPGRFGKHRFAERAFLVLG